MKLLERTSIFLLLWVAKITLLSATSIAVVPPSSEIALPDINSAGPGAAIDSIIAWTIGLTAVLTILAITWAGIQMVLAVWEEEKMKKARYTMIYAFVWLIIAWLAYGMVKFVTNLNLDGFL
jgi:hypothetical protein